jgi:hypothetical protein
MHSDLGFDAMGHGRILGIAVLVFWGVEGLAHCESFTMCHDVSWMPFSARLNKNSVFTRHLLKLFLLKPQLFFRMLD